MKFNYCQNVMCTVIKYLLLNLLKNDFIGLNTKLVGRYIL